MLINVKQGSPEWFTARLGKITASVASAVLGINPWHGPFWAYQEIMGKHKHGKPNLLQQYGLDNEAKARSCYEVLTGNLVTETGLWVSDEHPWLAASPDGLVGAEGTVEIKCLSELPEGLPSYHEMQMRVQMICTGRDWGDYFCWLPDRYCRFTVCRDEMIELDLIARLQEFYYAHLATGTPPARRRQKS